MKEFYYVTPECKNEAQGPVRQRLSKKIDRYNEGDGCLDNDRYGRFTGNYFGIHLGNLRVFGFTEERIVDGQSIKCNVFTRVIPKGDSDTRRVQSPLTTDEDRRRIVHRDIVDWTPIEAFVRQRLAAPLTATADRKPLSDAETSFLADTHITLDIFDVPVYESTEWIQVMKSDEFDDRAKVAIELENFFGRDNVDGLHEVEYGFAGEKMLIYRFRHKNKESLFLLGLGASNVIQDLRQRWEKRCEKIDLDTETGKDMLVRTCRRAYPLTMLDDKDLWIGMEKEEEGPSNFYLSDEEMGIVSGTLDFPLFIKGQAGSGKSTVLQYLFAEYLLRCLTIGNVAPPLYLSSSAELVKKAEKLSRSLFGKNHAYLAKCKEIKLEFSDVGPYFQETFFVFQELVRQLIEEKNKEVLAQRFARGKYVNYSTFRRMWQDMFGNNRAARRRYGPAISWHVIRSYIKGWNWENFCNPEHYTEIGSRNQTVTAETFKLVYQKVWEEWYQQITQDGYWDDLDLVRYCLKPDDGSADTCVDPRFSAVFCDESQDFTRVELEFILRSSIFSQRKIFDENVIGKFPFIFVGDEFQTLNPTGFSWTMLRSYFTERLIHTLDFSTTHGVQDPVTLTKNYRSTEPIVKFANRLQLLRQARFRGDAVPQSPNFADQDAQPVYCLDPNNPEVWDKLKDINAVLIVPCEDGQTTKDYIENSTIRDYIEFNEDGSPQRIDILSPTQAKGLEYKVVAIYGFENKEDLMLTKLRKFFAEDIPRSADQEIDLKYFLNNAYVSITRAKRQLFIIDRMVEKEKSFWDFAFSDARMQKDVKDLEDKMLSLAGKEWTAQDLGWIVSGSISDLSGDSVVTDPLENAQKHEKQGTDMRDAGIMRMAAARYRERSKKDDALRCEAFAEEYDGHYLVAGEKFKEAKRFDDSVRCFWLAGSTESDRGAAMKALNGLRQRSSSLEVRMARQHQKTQPDIDELRNILGSLRDILLSNDRDSQSKIYDSSIQWQDALNSTFRRVAIDSTRATRDRMNIVLDLCNELADEELPLDLDFQADWHYQLGNESDAIRLWEEWGSLGKPINSENYYESKVKALPYPDNLEYGKKINGWEQNIMEEYRQKSNKTLTSEQRSIVANAALKCGKNNEIRYFLPELLLDTANRTEVLKILNAAVHRDKTIPRDALEALLRCKWRESLPAKMSEELQASSQTRDLLQMIRKLQEVRSSNFVTDLDRAFRVDNKKVIDLMNEKFRSFSRTVWNQPLLTEVGGVFEKRGHFLDALRYYQWAKDQTDDPEFKRELELRWIACKERQADHDKSEEYRKEAEKRRSELGAHDDLPLEPYFNRWKLIFEKVMSFTVEQKVLDQKISEPKMPLPGPQLTQTSTSEEKAKPKTWFDMDFFGYALRFNPASFELSIELKTENEDLTAKIKNGRFPQEEPDFVVEDRQLLKSSGEPTSFSIDVSETEIVLTHDESGIQVHFLR